MRTALIAAALAAATAVPAALAAATAVPAAAFELTSPDIAEGAAVAPAQLLNGFGCTGGNRSPALAWSGAPAGTRSFALTVYDPDAPTGSGWWHWVVFNLPASATGLPAGAGDPAASVLPAGAVQGRTDFGGPGYGGPCPPAGDAPHRYVFTVHALSAESLPLGADASGAMAGFFIRANTLATASLTARHGR